MESIIDNERDEARSLARECDERPERGYCPDIMGRDIVGGYEPPRPVFDFDPETDPF